MSINSASVQNLVILSGASASNWLPLSVLSDADALIVMSPTLDAHTFVFEVTYDVQPDVTAPTHTFVWNNGTSDVAPPATGKATVYPVPNGFTGIRIKDQSGNVAADRTFHVRKVYEGASIR